MKRQLIVGGATEFMDGSGWIEISTTSPRSARRAIEEAIGEHHLSTPEPPELFGLRMVAGWRFGVTLAIARWDCAVCETFARLRAAYLVVRCARGKCSFTLDGERISLEPGCALVVSPGQELEVVTEDCATLQALKIHQRLMHRAFFRLRGWLPMRPLRFQPVPGAAGWQEWFQRIYHLLRKFDHGRQPWDNRISDGAIEMFVRELVRFACDEYRDWTSAPSEPGRLGISISVLEAAQFIATLIRADPRRTVSVLKCARMAGISVAELTAAFGWLWGMTLDAYRRDILMQCIYEELCDADAGQTTVDEIVKSWYLGCNARFYRDYHQACGEWPGETLRRLPSG